MRAAISRPGTMTSAPFIARAARRVLRDRGRRGRRAIRRCRLQGCGHFIIEAAIRTFVPARRTGSLHAARPAHYAERMERLAREAGRVVGDRWLSRAVTAPLDPAARSRRRWPPTPTITPSSAWSTARRAPASSTIVRAIGAVVRAAGTAHDRRRGLGVRRAAARHRPRSRRSMRSCSPPTSAWRACRALAFAVARIDRLAAAAGPGGQLVVRSGATSMPIRCAHGPGSCRFTPPAQVLAALQHGARPATRRRAASRRGSRATRRTCARCTTASRALGLTPWLAAASCRGRS